MSALYCGVDFGTTNSTVGVCEEGGAPALVPLEGEEGTIPSALFFSLDGGGVSFGRDSVSRYMNSAEGRFMRALKSILGTGLMEETTLVGRDRLTFQRIIGRFLGHLRRRIEAAHGEVPRKVVFGRPVRFVDDDDAADRRAQDQLETAAHAEGFGHVEFQFEPVAAALHIEHMLSDETLALVVDIGGGTSDFSILRLSPQRARNVDRAGDILGTSGVHVGGTDFDRQLSIAHVMPHFGLGTRTLDGKRHLPVWYFNDMATWHRINRLYTGATLRDIRSLMREAAEPAKLERYLHLLEHRSGHRLAAHIEAAKIALTDAPATEIHFSEPGLDFIHPVTRTEFEATAHELVQRIDSAIGKVLRLAGVEARDIETVILTGGGAQVPLVQAAATARFPHAQTPASDQFGSVGMGLALDARRRFGHAGC